DAFAHALNPDGGPVLPWQAAMAETALAGLRKAARVFTSTQVMAARLRAQGLDPRRIVVAPLGIAPELKPGVPLTVLPALWSEKLGRAPYVLHVGSNIPRKEVSFLLKLFGRLHAQRPGLVLVQLGGPLTPEQRAQAESLGLTDALIQPP